MNRLFQKRIPALLILVLFWVPRTAVSDEAGMSAVLVWRVDRPADAVCLEGAAVERAVERRLNRPLFTGAVMQDLRIDGTISSPEDGNGLRVDFVMRDRNAASLGGRSLSLSFDTCREMVDTLSLVVTMMLTPLLSREERVSVPPEPGSMEVAPDASIAKPVENAPATQRTVRFTVSAGLVVVPGLLPEPLPGVGGGIGVRLNGRWEVQASVEGAFRQTVPALGGYVDMSYLQLGGQVAFLLLRRERLELGAPIGVYAGVLRYKGRGFRVDEEDAAWTATGDLGLEFSIRLSDYIRLTLDAAVMGVFIRREVAVLDEESRPVVVHRLPAVAFKGGVFLNALF